MTATKPLALDTLSGGHEPQPLPRAAAASVSDPSPPCLPYRKRHRPVTSSLTNEEHATLSRIAAAIGSTPSALATTIIRVWLAREFPLAPDDDYENATLVYGDDD